MKSRRFPILVRLLGHVLAWILVASLLPVVSGSVPTGTAAYRIPDELGASVIGEVKNVSRLHYSNQLRDFAAYAKENELQFNLYVRRGTQLSGPLQDAVDSGAINLVRSLP